MTRIHPTAVVHPSAEIDEDVEIGHYCFVGEGVRIGAGSVLMNNAVVFANTRLGERNILYPFAVLGTPAQDIRSSDLNTELIVGDGNTFREFVTIHRGTEHDAGKTVIGNNNFLMAYVHIAHDCIIEDEVIMANGVQIGGHCHIESYANFGGLAALHHFVTVGRYAFVGGLSRIVRDVPPFMTVEGNPSEVRCVNSIGLRRRGFDSERIENLKKAFRILYHRRLPTSEAIKEIEATLQMNEDISYLLQSIRKTMGGRTGRARESMKWQEDKRSCG